MQRHRGRFVANVDGGDASGRSKLQCVFPSAGDAGNVGNDCINASVLVVVNVDEEVD